MPSEDLAWRPESLARRSR